MPDTAPALKPSHPVCDHTVEVPTLLVIRAGEGYPLAPPETVNEEIVTVQWIGESFVPGLKDTQFRFPIQSKPDRLLWMGHPERFQVVFMGKLRNRPNPDAIPMFVQSGNMGPETIVIYVITSHYGLDNGEGGTRCPAFIIPVISLGDPLFTVIRPKTYLNLSVSERVMRELTESSSRTSN